MNTAFMMIPSLENLIEALRHKEIYIEVYGAYYDVQKRLPYFIGEVYN